MTTSEKELLLSTAKMVMLMFVRLGALVVSTETIDAQREMLDALRKVKEEACRG